MPLPTAVPSAAAVCARVLAAVPAQLPGRLARRAVTGDPQRSAAWGTPAVTLACGTAPDTDPTSQLVQIGPASGGVVTFAVVDAPAGTAFTASGLAVPVTITVPDAYDSTVLVPLTGPLLALDR